MATVLDLIPDRISLLLLPDNEAFCCVADVVFAVPDADGDADVEGEAKVEGDADDAEVNFLR